MIKIGDIVKLKETDTECYEVCKRQSDYSLMTHAELKDSKGAFLMTTSGYRFCQSVNLLILATDDEANRFKKLVADNDIKQEQIKQKLKEISDLLEIDEKVRLTQKGGDGFTIYKTREGDMLVFHDNQNPYEDGHYYNINM